MQPERLCRPGLLFACGTLDKVIRSLPPELGIWSL